MNKKLITYRNGLRYKCFITRSPIDRQNLLILYFAYVLMRSDGITNRTYRVYFLVTKAEGEAFNSSK